MVIGPGGQGSCAGSDRTGSWLETERSGWSVVDEGALWVDRHNRDNENGDMRWARWSEGRVRENVDFR